MPSPTALANFLACHHLMTLGREEAQGTIKKPYAFPDPNLELLARLGDEHERAYLRYLRDEQCLDVVEIIGGPPQEAAEATLDALRRGVDSVFQARLEDGLWRGRADFLVRVDKPSRLGAWSYEPVETKLARSTKGNAVIQLCFYSQLLETIQGVAPDWMHVVLGSGVPSEKLSVRRYITYFRKVRAEFDRASENAPVTYPEPNEHCYVCDWSPLCDDTWRRDDHLSLVARITRTQRKALVGRGITTMAGLGELAVPVVPRIERIGAAALDRIHNQARVQVEGRETGKHVHELILPVEAERGLAALPPPCAGDIFLDLEGYAFGRDGALEYLFGIATADDAGSGVAYEPIWALNKAQEKAAFEKFIALVMERRNRFPNMHIYHYAAYERTAIKRLAAEHATCIDEVDELLRGNILVDLYRVVTQGLRASVESYSIKKLEPFYGFNRDIRLADATAALKSFEYLLAIGEQSENPNAFLPIIESYNRDDCVSALRLREWLGTLRLKLEAENGDKVPRPAPKASEPSDELSAQVQRARLIATRLTESLPADETDWTKEQKACWLLAQMLEWHRREEKSEWWEYYRLRELSDDELQEAKNAIGGLTYAGEAGRVKQSIIHSYRFPPQMNSIERARKIHDPATGRAAGTPERIDDLTGTIELKRGTRSDVPHPTALIPRNIVDSRVLRESLFRLASWVCDNGIDSPGPRRAARDLLLRHPPRLVGAESLISIIAGEPDLTRPREGLGLHFMNRYLPSRVLPAPERLTRLPV
jgi:predicted RecB family nuclease